MSGRNRSRSSIEWQDIVAASYVVGKDLVECDYLDHQEAVDNLPSEGGSIFTLPGTYTRSATISIGGTKEFVFTFAGGATISISTAIPIFTIPDDIQGRPYNTIYGGTFMGTALAGQELVHYSDSSAHVEVKFENSEVRGLQTLVNFTEYDITYFFVAYVKFFGCYLPPPDAGLNVPIKSPNPAGTYTGALAVHFEKCMMTDSNDYTNKSWGSINFDGDIFMWECEETRFLATSTWEVDGLDVYGTEMEHVGGGRISITMHGPSFNSFLVWEGVTLYRVDVTFPDGARCSNIGLNGGKLIFTGRFVCDNVFVRQDPADISIDVTETGVNGTITGCVFMDSATAAIRIAGQAITVTGCVFDSTGAHKTILEVSPADFNTYDNNTGTDGAGGGLVTVGVSTRVEGALYSLSTGETTDAYVTLFTRINPNGLLGIGTIKNTDGANSLTVRETVTDAFGVTTSVETPVTFGNDYMLDVQTNFNTARPPYWSYAVAVKATTPGNQADYTARMVFQGAQV